MRQQEKGGEVEIKIVDILGRQVRSLVSESKPAGHHQIPWDGLDDDGGGAASGVYLCVMETKGHSQVHKLLLLK